MLEWSALTARPLVARPQHVTRFTLTNQRRKSRESLRLDTKGVAAPTTLTADEAAHPFIYYITSEVVC